MGTGLGFTGCFCCGNTGATHPILHFSGLNIFFFFQPKWKNVQGTTMSDSLWWRQVSVKIWPCFASCVTFIFVHRHAFSLHTCWWLLHWRWPPLGYQHLSFISILVFAKYPWQISFFSSPFFSVICWYWYAGPGIARKFTPTFTCSQFKISPVLWWCALLMLNMNWPTQFPPSNK